MTDRELWQEIDTLRKKIVDLEQRLAQQPAVIGQIPKLRCVDVTSNDGSTYSGQERDVDADYGGEISEISIMPNDPNKTRTVGETQMVLVDNQGKRYFLPSGGSAGILAIEDKGDGTGTPAVKTQTGDAVSNPAGAVNRPIVAAEPSSAFYFTQPPFKLHRVYPGMLMTDPNDGTLFYLVFVEGVGDTGKTFTQAVTATGSFTFTLKTDTSGKVTDFTVA